MSFNQILIVLNGEDSRVFSSNSNKIVLAKKKLTNISEDHTLLQSTFESLEDLIKAEILIKNQFSKKNIKPHIKTYVSKILIRELNLKGVNFNLIF